MTLHRLDFEYKSVVAPKEILEFLRATEGVVSQHRVNAAKTFHGFVPSDYQTIYRCLKALFDSQLLTGERFCEWGSGVSVVASLAALIGYESYGIEYDETLCRAAEKIQKEFDVSVELVNGSFIPNGIEDLIDDAFANQDGELALYTESDDAYEMIDYTINDFDIIFTYPWPNDAELTNEIFDRCAADGALLLVYYDEDSISLYRKG